MNRRIAHAASVAVLIASVSFAQPSLAQPGQQPPPENLSAARQLADSLSDVFEVAANQVSPSVVAIYAVSVEPAQASDLGNQFGFGGDDFFRRFFGLAPGGGAPQTVQSLGSGVIVSDDGYILTNNHVVAGSTKLSVVLSDGRTQTAKIIGTDPPTDLAVIKVDVSDLPAAELAASEKIKVGQWVIAVGNPYQLMHTVTAGIISAKGRSSVGLADYEDFIQTDASINPGNSGGALADLDGRVIGINTAISTPSGGNVGIGFAIPISMAQGIMEQLVTTGKVSRGYLGLVPQDIDAALAKALGLESTKGVLVGDVFSGGPADEAGVRRGDVILDYNGQPIHSSVQLRELVANTKPGTTATVAILRQGQQETIDVKLGSRPENQQQQHPQAAPQPQSRERLGLEVQTLTRDLAAQLGVEGTHGVIVVRVVPGGPADDAGIHRGDVIEELDRQSITSSDDFEQVVSSLKSGSTVPVLIERQRYTLYVAIHVPSRH